MAPPAMAQEVRIRVTPEMVVNEAPFGDPAGIVDEQELAGDPPSGAGLRHAAQEEVLVDAHLHGQQCAHDPFVADGVARGDERRAQRTGLGFEPRLDAAQHA